MIEGKVVRLGNSAAIAIKKKDLKENKLKFNQTLKISVIRQDNERALSELFGIAKGAKPFKREEKDRVF
ncbi:MAG: hypothetical protein QT03_C0001G0621 [archaeon GW2011_AR10]|uniref:AbrB/MazE/SpoVT family DNA-binding domain-containing protein n=1 Tax=Candidatus Iainarchaeum sp. TaxID=3101447 RepID=A0A7J4IU49_9ARCH|nr:MAG: hypothetical protein QT03_C0001G0621 [archaeon GW2011_AR10]HIH07775.1 hypothetical protein [Candidatus Diapherotrites archaeon]